MIIFVTTRGHEYTVLALTRRNFGADLPHVRVTNYDKLFRAKKTQSATHVFTDIERLHAWELGLAADLYHSLGETGVRRLNDPTKAKSRYQLLRALHQEGLNPFQVYRAEDHPCPKRFPVFLRYEFDHGRPISPLIETQDRLDDFIESLPAAGTPLRGVIVIEYCAEPVAPNLWKRYGTFSIGGKLHTDHTLVEDSWCVKEGLRNISRVSEEKFLDEREAIIENRFAEAISPAFKIAQIDYGRADHGTVGGRQVVYEINTNPSVSGVRRQLSPIRDEAFAIGRERFAKLLWQIDSGDAKKISIPHAERLRQYSRENFWTRSPRRP
jgi:hypothetical protein